MKRYNIPATYEIELNRIGKKHLEALCALYSKGYCDGMLIARYGTITLLAGILVGGICSAVVISRVRVYYSKYKKKL